MPLTTKTFIAPHTGVVATNPYLVARQSSISTNPNSVSFYAFVYWNKEAYEQSKEPIYVRQINLSEEALSLFEAIPTPDENINLFNVGLALYYQYLLTTEEFAEWQLID